MRRGNKMARERMSILYDVSAAEHALVVGTSNKTELLLGYSTLFGDSACAIMPIGDVYKTQVRALSRWMGVPEAIVRKPPSADLWEGQTDEGELGITYDLVDRLLYQLVDRRRRPRELAALGFPAEVVERVWRMVQRSHYKRKLPVVLKLSARTVDKDFLYPRDWAG
jgi:NAD+ synthase